MGAERYIELAQEISSRGKKAIDIFGILINLFELKTIISKEIENVSRERWGSKVFKTKIRKNVAIGEARIKNQTIFEYAPHSNGAKDFKALTAEVLNVSKEA